MELPCGHPDRWEEEAKAALAYTSQSLFHAHRGAIPWLIRDTSIIFANVGYSQDEHARQEVDVLRRMLRDQNIRELGFALDADGYSWVLLVHSDSAAELNDLIWKAAVVSGAPGGNGVQRPIAQTAIAPYYREAPTCRSTQSLLDRAFRAYFAAQRSSVGPRMTGRLADGEITLLDVTTGKVLATYTVEAIMDMMNNDIFTDD